LGDVSSYDPLDYINMRKWLKDVYLTLDMNIPTRRSRTTASISVKNVPISYEENKHFRVRIRDPVPDAGKEGCLRPALLMLHGGGWIHSFPEVDEGASI
jgi:acetyl esterase/lipase